MGVKRSTQEKNELLVEWFSQDPVNVDFERAKAVATSECHGQGPDMDRGQGPDMDRGQGPAGEVKGKARKKTSNEGRVIFGEPGRQQPHHGFRDHELQVLGSRETRVTRIGFRRRPDGPRPGRHGMVIMIGRQDPIDAGAVRHLIDQPRRIHMMDICEYLVPGTGGVVGC
jgi:hypothetical protein